MSDWAARLATGFMPTRCAIHWSASALVARRFAIARYAPDERIPAWALDADGFVNINRTEDELAVLAREKEVPFNAQAERGWIACRLSGTFDINATGVLARLLNPLAESEISILAFSTYDTDIILFNEKDRDAAVEALAKVADVSGL